MINQTATENRVPVSEAENIEDSSKSQLCLQVSENDNFQESHQLSNNEANFVKIGNPTQGLTKFEISKPLSEEGPLPKCQIIASSEAEDLTRYQENDLLNQNPKTSNSLVCNNSNSGIVQVHYQNQQLAVGLFEESKSAILVSGLNVQARSQQIEYIGSSKTAMMPTEDPQLEQNILNQKLKPKQDSGIAAFEKLTSAELARNSYQTQAKPSPSSNSNSGGLSSQVRNRPQRENRKKPSHFGFNYCHQCRRTECIDDLIRCLNEDCPNHFCFNCIKKNKMKISSEYTSHGGGVNPGLKAEFQKLKDSETFICPQCRGECPCSICNENALFNDVRLLQLGILEDEEAAANLASKNAKNLTLVSGQAGPTTGKSPICSNSGFSQESSGSGKVNPQPEGSSSIKISTNGEKHDSSNSNKVILSQIGPSKFQELSRRKEDPKSHVTQICDASNKRADLMLNVDQSDKKVGSVKNSQMNEQLNHSNNIGSDNNYGALQESRDHLSSQPRAPQELKFAKGGESNKLVSIKYPYSKQSAATYQYEGQLGNEEFGRAIGNENHDLSINGPKSDTLLYKRTTSQRQSKLQAIIATKKLIYLERNEIDDLEKYLEEEESNRNLIKSKERGTQKKQSLQGNNSSSHESTTLKQGENKRMKLSSPNQKQDDHCGPREEKIIDQSYSKNDPPFSPPQEHFQADSKNSGEQREYQNQSNHKIAIPIDSITKLNVKVEDDTNESVFDYDVVKEQLLSTPGVVDITKNFIDMQVIPMSHHNIINILNEQQEQSATKGTADNFQGDFQNKIQQVPQYAQTPYLPSLCLQNVTTAQTTVLKQVPQNTICETNQANSNIAKPQPIIQAPLALQNNHTGFTTFQKSNQSLQKPISSPLSSNAFGQQAQMAQHQYSGNPSFATSAFPQTNDVVVQSAISTDLSPTPQQQVIQAPNHSSINHSIQVPSQFGQQLSSQPKNYLGFQPANTQVQQNGQMILQQQVQQIPCIMTSAGPVPIQMSTGAIIQAPTTMATAPIIAIDPLQMQVVSTQPSIQIQQQVPVQTTYGLQQLEPGSYVQQQLLTTSNGQQFVSLVPQTATQALIGIGPNGQQQIILTQAPTNINSGPQLIRSQPVISGGNFIQLQTLNNGNLVEIPQTALVNNVPQIINTQQLGSGQFLTNPQPLIAQQTMQNQGLNQPQPRQFVQINDQQSVNQMNLIDHGTQMMNQNQNPHYHQQMIVSNSNHYSQGQGNFQIKQTPQTQAHQQQQIIHYGGNTNQQYVRVPQASDSSYQQFVQEDYHTGPQSLHNQNLEESQQFHSRYNNLNQQQHYHSHNNQTCHHSLQRDQSRGQLNQRFQQQNEQQFIDYNEQQAMLMQGQVPQQQQYSYQHIGDTDLNQNINNNDHYQREIQQNQAVFNQNYSHEQYASQNGYY